MRRPFRTNEEQALQKRIQYRLETVEQLVRSGNCEQASTLLDGLQKALVAWTQAEWERKHNELLSEVAISLSKAIALEDILAQIIDGLARILPFDAAGVFLVEGDGKHIAAEYLRGYRRDSYQLVHQKVGEGVVGNVVTNGRTAIIGDVSTDPHYISARNGTRSELAVPMFSPVTGEVIGVFNLESNNLFAYADDDAELLSTLAANAAVAIERAQMYRRLMHQQRMNEELALARRIQVSLLPPDQTITGLELHGHSISSEQVGGDYYDFFTLTEEDVAITIADVAGKGIPAALIMAGLRGSLRVEARNTYSIGTILKHVNMFLHSTSQPGEYVTLFYGVINTTRNELTYSNAGHNPAVLRKKDGTIQQLSIGSVPVGAFPEAQWPETTIPFVPGDFLLLYTDGVTEAENKEGIMFGQKRLLECINTCGTDSADAILEAVKTAVNRHLDGLHAGDDLTMLAVVYKEVSDAS
ncbi:MAG: SpoIIE family protein phosphatase [bacterium]|nr:SpoIIE family protein phosphatase [bacterium]